MAWMNQERKKELAAAAKKVLPADWKVTFGVRHHSSIVCTIKQAPKSVLSDYLGVEDSDPNRPCVNHYHLDRAWKGESHAVLKALVAALHKGNHDNSDIMTDYFDVGWYVDIGFGKWDKPCLFV